MNPELDDLGAESARALQDYLAGSGEVALQRVYELGRRILASGFGVLDLVTVQHRALRRCLLKARTPSEGSRVLRAGHKLLVESLLPFEMSHRRIQEVNGALRESERRYRDVVETARDVIYTLSTDGTIRSLNPAFETITGWPRTEWIGKPFAPLVHPADVPRAAQLYQMVLDGKVPPMFELRIVSKSGGAVPGEFMATPLVEDGRIVGLLGVARDITDRKRAEEALRRLNDALEEEVKRIAHALHDESGQLLASVHIMLADIARDVPAHVAERVNGARGLLTKIEEQLRQLSHELRPTILDDLGLRPALEFLANGVSGRTGLRISVESTVGRHLPPQVETVVYRVAQEALTNVTKHAHATSVSVRVSRAGRALRCSIRDDGSGFEPAAVLARRGARGLGLIGIQERLSAIGGRLDIVSSPGNGTELLLSIPIEAGGAD